jgi:hypothetical protein
MLDGQAPDIQVIADGRDDIMLTPRQPTHRTIDCKTLNNLPQSSHKPRSPDPDTRT